MLKIGDKVRIRTWEDLEGSYEVRDGGIYELDFVSGMKDFCGLEVVIKEVIGELPSAPGTFYTLENYSYYWHEDLFEKDFSLLEEKETEVFKKEIKPIEEYFINTTPGMYKTYNGPKSGEILREALLRENSFKKEFSWKK